MITLFGKKQPVVAAHVSEPAPKALDNLEAKVVSHEPDPITQIYRRRQEASTRMATRLLEVLGGNAVMVDDRGHAEWADAQRMMRVMSSLGELLTDCGLTQHQVDRLVAGIGD